MKYSHSSHPGRFFYNESNIRIFLTNELILINISWNPYFSQISLNTPIQRLDICPPVSSGFSWLWVSLTKESKAFFWFSTPNWNGPYVSSEVEGAWVVKKEDHIDQGLSSWHHPLWYCPGPPGTCIFSKVLSVQTFIVPFNLVPLRSTQPCPTMPRGSHEPLCSPSLFRTQSQQRLWVLVERELCLFIIYQSLIYVHVDS